MTPNNHDDLSSDLGRALHDRADGLVGAPITLSDVKGRASRIRRRRAVAASAAAAAAIAIIVPTAIAGSDMFDTSTDRPPASGGPNPTETTGDAQSWPQRLDPTGLELGVAPQVTWREGTTLHTPDGDLELPATYSQAVRYDDGWLALDYANGEVVRLDASGQELDTNRSQGPIATSSDGDAVLYVGDGSLILHDNTTGEDTVIGGGHRTTVPVAVVSGTAYYNVDSGTFPHDGRWWDGEEHDPSPEALQPWNDVSGDGVSVSYSSIDDSGTCSILRGPVPNAEVQGESCAFTLEKFSPDGQHLILAPAYREGFADGEIGVIPADGSEVEDGDVTFHFQRRGDADPFFVSSAWEDDDHILVVTFTPDPGSAQGTWQILRIGLDGSAENAVEPVEANDQNAPFSLL